MILLGKLQQIVIPEPRLETLGMSDFETTMSAATRSIRCLISSLNLRRAFSLSGFIASPFGRAAPAYSR